MYPFDVAYDRNGFRNPRDLESADVVVLGDSFVEGGLVAADEILTAVLARRLGRDVANLGQSAYGPQQELAVLKRFATPLKPRICLWTFYEGNDLDDAARYEAETEAEPAGGSTRLERSFAWNLSRALAGELGRVLDPSAAERAPWGTFHDLDGRPARLYFSAPDGARPSTSEAALDTVIAALNEARSLCATRRVPLLVVFAPAKFRVYQDFCTFENKSPCARWRCDDLPARLAARIEALGPGIGMLDLTPALKDAAARGRLVYFADDTHWSAAGHETVAGALAEAIACRDELNVAPRP